MSVVSPTRTILQPARVLSTTTTRLTRPTALTSKAKMSSDSTATPNFNFPERQATPDEKALIDDVLQLCASPSDTSEAC